MSKAVQAALRILIPSPDQRSTCADEIEHALRMVEDSDRSVLLSRTKADTKEIAKARAALAKAQAAMKKMSWLDAHELKRVCDIEAGITCCQQILDEQKANPSKPKPPSHRQRTAVAAAHTLVMLWLVERRGLYDADAISRNSPWHKLAQLLIGEPINLLRYMSEQEKRTKTKQGLKVR